MELDLVLNELSSIPADNIVVARQLMSGFVRTAQNATIRGARRVIRSSYDINQLILADNYPIARWRNDPDVDIDEVRYFKLLVTKYPELSDLEDAMDEIQAHEFFFNGSCCQSLGIAYFINALAISLHTDRCWSSSMLNLIHSYLEDEDNILTNEVSVHHACSVENVEENAEWISLRVTESIMNGIELWENREEFLPCLSFCSHIEGTLKGLGPGILFYQVRRRLIELNEFIQRSETGRLNLYDLSNASQESPETLARYHEERTFSCPDRITRTFSWHLRVAPGVWRIYFEPFGENRCVVGYIGPHLRTVKYR